MSCRMCHVWMSLPPYRLCLATTSPSPSPSPTPSSPNQRPRQPWAPFIRCTSSSPTVPLDTVDLLDVDLCQTGNPSSPLPTKHPWLVTCMNLQESRRRLVTRQKRGGASRCSSQEPRGAASFSRRRTEALSTTRFFCLLFVSFGAHAAKCGDTTSQPHFCCFYFLSPLLRSRDPASLSLSCAGIFPASWRQVRPATAKSHVWRDEDWFFNVVISLQSRLLSLTRLSLWLSTLGLASRRSALKSPSRYLELPCSQWKRKFQHLAAKRGGLAGRECRHSVMAAPVF